MRRMSRTLLAVGLALLAHDAGAIGPPVTPDHYLCYRASLAKNQPKFPKGQTKALWDQFGGPQSFTVTKITTVCNPADLDGSLISHPTVHLEGFALKAQKGAARFVRSTHVARDQFAERNLTITGPAALLDVTPKALGGTPPGQFGSDPTSDPTVNRFKCYKAKLAKGSAKLVPPAPPTVTDEFFTGGRQLVVKKVTKLCQAVDADGETPGAATRPASLVCYAVKLATRQPKFTKPTVATNAANVGPHVLVASKMTELCVPAVTDPPPPDGPPIVATSQTWTWVDFPDSACDDGSPTGIGVNLASSQDVLVVLAGGGVCWDFTTCYSLNTAVHGPFGQTQFAAAVSGFTDTILDRQLAANPFAGWNLVYVPYCTGDAHAGDNVAAYKNGQTTKMYHHVGHANLLTYLSRLGPTFPTVDKLVVGGLSSGGFGTLFDYATFRGRWPTGQLYLLDDSGPLLEASAFAGTFVADWFTNWHLGDVTDPVCGVACRGDLSQLMPALATAYPSDRLALLSSVQDGTIRSLYGLTPPGFESALLGMASDRLDPTARFRYFFVAGTTHTMLGAPASFSQNGTSLLTWLNQLVTDDPAWTAIKP